MNRHELLAKYRQLMNTGSGETHARRYRALEVACIENYELLVEIICDPQGLPVKDVMHIMSFTGHAGSVKKKDNHFNATVFYPALRARWDELPPSIQRYLEWVERVHEY